MEKLKLNPTLIKAIVNLYKDNTLQIKINNNVSNWFEISKGLRQGCGLLPAHFKIYLDRIFHGWSRKFNSMGIQIGESILSTLFFADDQLVIANDEMDLDEMVRKLNEAFNQGGLKINSKNLNICLSEII